MILTKETKPLAIRRALSILLMSLVVLFSLVVFISHWAWVGTRTFEHDYTKQCQKLGGHVYGNGMRMICYKSRIFITVNGFHPQ